MRLLLECIHLEENPHYYLTSAAEAIEIVRAVNHPQVQFLYDIYHEQMSFGQLIEKLEKNIDVIGLIHIADVPGRHEPGTGEINYANIYRKLAQLNYKHMVAMEFKPKGDPVATLRAARAETIRPRQPDEPSDRPKLPGGQGLIAAEAGPGIRRSPGLSAGYKRP